MPFCIWFSSLSIMSSRFIHGGMYQNFILLLRLTNIPFYVLVFFMPLYICFVVSPVAQW